MHGENRRRSEKLAETGSGERSQGGRAELQAEES